MLMKRNFNNSNKLENKKSQGNTHGLFLYFPLLELHIYLFLNDFLQILS